MQGPGQQTLGRQLLAGREQTGRDQLPRCLETRIYSRLGIPSVAFGPGPFSQMHGPGEHVPIDNLVEAATVYAITLAERLGTAGR